MHVRSISFRGHYTSANITFNDTVQMAAIRLETKYSSHAYLSVIGNQLIEYESLTHNNYGNSI